MGVVNLSSEINLYVSVHNCVDIVGYGMQDRYLDCILYYINV